MASLSINIKHIRETKYDLNEKRGISNKSNSLNRKKVNPLMNESDVLIHFIGNSISTLRGIVNMHYIQNIDWTNLFSKIK